MKLGPELLQIDYDHSKNPHTLAGAQAALSTIFANEKPMSLLDVGCGTGTWLKAAMESGVSDVMGIDGVEAPKERLQVPREMIRYHDLSLPWNLERRFDAVLCLEVAEHLDASSATTLIDALVSHGERIYFSAACPGQLGQHHVNCQWPAYWQRLFNNRGYICEDSLRWLIWDDERIEPWYRQNLLLARHAPRDAGLEPRIRGVVHPEILAMMVAVPSEQLRRIEEGRMPITWHLANPLRAFSEKLRRRFQKVALWTTYRQKARYRS